MRGREGMYVLLLSLIPMEDLLAITVCVRREPSSRR